jgi:hypothetical protein
VLDWRSKENIRAEHRIRQSPITLAI